jgi:hypothetical protein
MTRDQFESPFSTRKQHDLNGVRGAHPTLCKRFAGPRRKCTAADQEDSNQ